MHSKFKPNINPPPFNSSDSHHSVHTLYGLPSNASSPISNYNQFQLDRMNFCSFAKQTDSFLEIYRSIDLQFEADDLESQKSEASIDKKLISIVQNQQVPIKPVSTNSPKKPQTGTTLASKSGELPSNSNNQSQSQLQKQFSEKFTVIASKPIMKGQEYEAILEMQKWGNINKLDADELVVRKINRSAYELIKLQLGNKGPSQKWKDSSFQQINNNQSGKDLAWKRLNELPAYQNKKIVFIDRNINPEDILQGQTGNCYFLSTVSALAANKQRILKLFPSLQINQNGIYMARLVFKGIMQEVIVDDRFPCNYNNNQLQLVGCKPSNNNEIWVMILEKCWAKLWGSYAATTVGFPHQALHSLTGAVTKNYLIPHQSPQKQKQLFSKMISNYKKGYVVCASTLSKQNTAICTDMQSIDLFPDHAYSILLFDNQIQPIVKLRNPWGKTQPKTQGNDRDQQFWLKYSQQSKNRLGVTVQDNGQFFMTWTDFSKYFSYITVCKIYDNANYLFLQLTCSQNKFKMIDLQTDGGYLAITLSQKDMKNTQSKELLYARVTLIVSEIISEGKEQVQYRLIRASTEGGFCDSYFQFTQMPKGKYRMAVYLSELKLTQSVTLSVYSPTKFGIKQQQCSTSQIYQFIDQSFLSHAKQSQLKQYIDMDMNDDIWIVNQVIPKCIFGYCALHVNKQSKYRYRINVGEEQYKDRKMRIWGQMQGEGKVQIETEPGFQSILIFQIDSFKKRPQKIPKPKITSYAY